MYFPYYIDLLGTLVFAVSGALAASEKGMYRDIFGITFTGFVTAVGGGTLRDVILSQRPVWVSDGNYLLVILAGVLVAALFERQIRQSLFRTLLLFDTIGMALFTIAGVQKSLAFGVSPIAAIILGLFSAIMGGVIRDTLINETPLMFREEIYATACIAGAALFVILHQFGISANLNATLSTLLIVLIRVLAVKRKWKLPKL
ncbi:MAG: trimeric intracellular cation channel family protein [Mucilaginibacter polytrichastri]|nr:trimeric intracellular cation channel family protein [Mucilaginibacter polytrichastri]